MRYEKIDEIAAIAHEINAALCRAYGDDSQPTWEDAPNWQKKSAIDGVIFNVNNPSAPANQIHNNWLEMKLKDGWVYGAYKCQQTRKHPCMLPFERLPIYQQAKSYIFKQVVESLRDK